MSDWNLSVNFFISNFCLNLGFDTTVEHPHTIIVRTCSMIKGVLVFVHFLCAACTCGFVR